MIVDAQGIHIGWDDMWESEYVFQCFAVYWAKRLSGQRTHLFDTSKLSIPDDYNRRIGGAPDIVACIDGRHVEIELKTKDGKPTGPQGRHQERTENALGKYVMARTLREVFEALEIEVPE